MTQFKDAAIAHRAVTVVGVSLPVQMVSTDGTAPSLAPARTELIVMEQMEDVCALLGSKETNANSDAQKELLDQLVVKTAIVDNSNAIQ